MIGILSSLAFITVFITVAIIVTIVLLEREKEGFANGVVSLILGLLLWNYSRDIWISTSTNVATTVYFAVGYVIIGVIWSFIKWNEKVKKIFTKFKSIKNNFIIEHGDIDVDNMKYLNSELDNKFTKTRFYSSDTFETISKKITPIGFENKSLIISWISYWPLSFLGTLLNNPFKRFFSWIYNSVSRFYDYIGNKHKNEVFGELKLKEKPTPTGNKKQTW